MVDPPASQAEHTRRTREAYDRLAPVWAATTDNGPFNGLLERPALRSLVPRPLRGAAVLDAGCGAGAQCEWLLDEGADVVGVDLSPAMVEQARRRCGGRGRFLVADLAEPLPLEPRSFDGITCSLALHYLRDWRVPLRCFARLLRPAGWLVLSLDHPFAPPLESQVGGYFDIELVADTWWKAEVEVTQQFLAASVGRGARRVRRRRVRGRPGHRTAAERRGAPAVSRRPGQRRRRPELHRLPAAPEMTEDATASRGLALGNACRDVPGTRRDSRRCPIRTDQSRTSEEVDLDKIFFTHSSRCSPVNASPPT